MLGHAFVTGATGFLGINLCRELRRRGWRVTALHRKNSNLANLADLGLTLVTGDIVDAPSVKLAMPEDVDVVFHVAGDTSLWRGHDAQQTRINVDGTRHVIAAARSQGAKRLVHTSTISALGRQPAPVDEQTESTAPRSFINYERSKHLAECEVRDAMATGLDAVILQPGAIMGPHDTTTWARVFYLLRDGKLPSLPPGRVPLNHVDEIVAAHIRAAQTAAAGSHYVLGGEDVALADLMRGMAARLGVKPPALVAPAPVLRLYGALMSAWGGLRGREPDVTREAAAFMAHANRADSSLAQRELDYRHRWMDECIDASHGWLTKKGLL